VCDVVGRAGLLNGSLACALLFAPCVTADPLSAERGFQASAAPTTGWHGAQDLAIYALGLIGVDYKFGGNTPDGGLDCSGLVRYVFQQVTGVTLPRTSQEISRLGQKIRLTELMPGDLVFFNTRRLQFSHVGIYLGDNRFIHAPRPGGEVEIVTLSKGYWQQRFDGARRLVRAIPGVIPSAHARTAPVGAPPDAQASDVGAVPDTSSAVEQALP
jgi:hypothetical protein